MSIYDFSAENIKGEMVDFSNFKNKTLLIVNTASKCGFTPQYKGLEELYEKYKNKGFLVLGFPCNQFGNQESGSRGQIEQFCQLNYNVSFPLFNKIKVNGKDTHPLYKYIKKQAPGFLGTEKIKWNFTKFLVNKDGKVLKRFASAVTPEKIAPLIEKIL